MPIELMADEVTAVDTSKTEINDSTITRFLPGDKTTIPEAKDTVPLPLLSNTNNLLSLLDALKSGDADNYDHVNMMARLDYDSRLMRVYSSPWGEFETIYPYGFSPSMLSRSDDIFNNHSFANPMPLPGSEEFIRMEHSDSYYLLTPSVSHLINPFGRMFTLHQPSDWYRSDSTIANVYARFGRAGLSNTFFSFNRPVDVLGYFRFDGTFSKFDGYTLRSRSETDRLRVMFEPEIHPLLKSDVTLFFDRTKGSKMFFPSDYEYTGDVTDNYSGGAFSTQYIFSKSTNYKTKISYQKNSQRVSVKLNYSMTRHSKFIILIFLQFINRKSIY